MAEFADAQPRASLEGPGPSVDGIGAFRGTERRRMRETLDHSFGSTELPPNQPTGHSDADVAAEGRQSTSRVARLARNSVFGTLAGAGTALASVLGTVIVANSLGVESTGVVAYALWVIMLVTAIADLGVQQTLARYLPELAGSGRSEEIARLVILLRRPVLISAGLAILGFSLYALSRVPFSREEGTLWILVGLTCALQALGGFTLGKLRGEQRFDVISLITMVSLVAQVAGVTIGCLTFGIPGALAGYCAGSVVPAVLAFRGAAPGSLLSAGTGKRASRYALYAWAAALSSTLVWSRAEVFFLQRSTGTAAVGLFTVGITLANMAAQGPMLLTSALLPHFSHSFGRGAVGEMQITYATATRLLAFLVFPACCGLAAVLPVVLPLMYGPEFAAAIPSATVLVISAGIGATASVGTSLIMAIDRSDYIFVTGIIAAALTVIAGFTVIPAYGLMGAAYARAAIQTFAVCIGCGVVLWRMRFPMPLGDLAKLLLAAAACGGVARACLILMPDWFGLPIAILAGAVTYIGLVRIVRGLPDTDLARLRAVSGSFPGRLRIFSGAALRILGAPPDRSTVTPEPVCHAERAR